MRNGKEIIKRASQALATQLAPHAPSSVNPALRGMHVDARVQKELKQPRQINSSLSLFPKGSVTHSIFPANVQKRAYSVQSTLAPNKKTYLERIEETQQTMAIMQAAGRNLDRKSVV